MAELESYATSIAQDAQALAELEDELSSPAGLDSGRNPRELLSLRRRKNAVSYRLGKKRLLAALG